MTEINDGGPAYPCASYPKSAEQVREIAAAAGVGLMTAKNWASQHTGMSLRDWFAGQALAGMSAGHDSNGPWAWTPDVAAASAYAVADAMLAAREPAP